DRVRVSGINSRRVSAAVCSLVNCVSHYIGIRAWLPHEIDALASQARALEQRQECDSGENSCNSVERRRTRARSSLWDLSHSNLFFAFGPSAPGTIVCGQSETSVHGGWSFRVLI